MPDRAFTKPIPHPAEVPPQLFQATAKWERIGLKWRELAERRHAHYLELYRSGRWQHYYTAAEFEAELATAIKLAQRWAAIAPRPYERTPAEIALAAAIERAKAA